MDWTTYPGAEHCGAGPWWAITAATSDLDHERIERLRMAAGKGTFHRDELLAALMWLLEVWFWDEINEEEL